MAYDEGALIGLRDGPNVRQVWDGLQSCYVLPEARIDAFRGQAGECQPRLFRRPKFGGTDACGACMFPRRRRSWRR